MDIKTILGTLHRHRVAYLLVGSLGAVAYGCRLRTSDVDICNATGEDDLRRTASALCEMGARLIREPSGRPMASVDVADWATLRLDDPLEHHLFSTPFGEIDVLPQPFGRGGWGRTTGYDELRSGAITVNAFGLSIPVAAFEDIAAAKLALGREQDREAEAELRRVGRLLARGDHPGYGLEEFAEES